MQVDYQPQVADLFSLGVIIFGLVTGRFPFADAVATDSFYGMFVRNQGQFWETHERSMKAPLPKEFKELMTIMFAYQPF